MRGYAVTHPPGQATLPVEDGWDQLVYAVAGTMTVATPIGSWTVPPNRALWLPDHTPATIANRFRIAVRTLYVDAGLHALTSQARMVSLTGLARELLMHAVRSCPLDVAEPSHRALLDVLFDQLRALPEDRLWLPAPATSPTARAAADLIRADPSLTLDEVARAVAASRRTLERAFLADTGLTLGAWRRRSRLLGSLEHLAAGRSVTETAVTSGYSTPSAFVTAFRRELGRTPGSYLPRPARSGDRQVVATRRSSPVDGRRPSDRPAK